MMAEGTGSIPIEALWYSKERSEWQRALDRYWELIPKQSVALERELESLERDRIRSLDAERWFEFLHDLYFPWKYTASNRLATSRALLKRGVERDGRKQLHRILIRLFEVDCADTAQCLFVASQLPGLGIAGASGLLSLLWPSWFGTVDQFVVLSLRRVESPYRPELELMKPASLDGLAGVILTSIMRKKAEDLSRQWGAVWTPRMIDKVLWATRTQSHELSNRG